MVLGYRARTLLKEGRGVEERGEKVEREEERGEGKETAYVPLRMGEGALKRRKRTGSQSVLSQVLDVPSPRIQ